MAGLCEGGNEPSGSLKANKRLLAFVIWIWRRLEHAKWTERIRNEAVLEGIIMLKLIRKIKKELVGSLAEKKLLTEGYTGKNGEREKSSG
ncbi:hypothetical protein ANN_03413 [Periplaneta americana]|uniref:Uncharacterized protein n=1 Tax=Periplaneta americana TaxID=6978 RepID=A0ABQ8TYZ2_PERAM|nr:hypothetical protein ANN_03413 [Periplaneta americana]